MSKRLKTKATAKPAPSHPPVQLQPMLMSSKN